MTEIHAGATAIAVMSDLFDLHGTDEQLAIYEGRYRAAMEAHDACRILAVAIKDEIDDLEPEDASATCDCSRCRGWYARIGRLP